MTMQDMVDYLKSNGFKASKTYISAAKHYEFHIEKDGNFMVSYFKYPEHDDRASRDRKQEEFLESLVAAFEKEYEHKDVFDGTLDRLRLHVGRRGFYVAVNKSFGHCPIYTVIVSKQGLQKSWSFTYDDPEITTFIKLKERVNWMMDELDDAIKDAELRDSKLRMEEKKMWPKINPFLTQGCGIKKVIFNDPATIVLWTDGTKTVVKCENECFDPEKGLAMAISKKALGNKGNYYNTFTKWLPEKPVDNLAIAFHAIGATDAVKNMKRFSKALKRMMGEE